VIGVMFMEDEKGLDSKVVLSIEAPDGRPLHELADADRRLMADYFNRYKRHEAGAYSNVSGWGSIAAGRQHVETTHAFFVTCRARAGQPCRVR
jgi:inorganic pyrophosphatase